MLNVRARLAIGLAILSVFGVVAGVAAAASPNVVISEFRFRGPSGGNDEFVELYNASAAAVDISGWLVKGSNSSGTNSTRATISAAGSSAPGATTCSRTPPRRATAAPSPATTPTRRESPTTAALRCRAPTARSSTPLA